MIQPEELPMRKSGFTLIEVMMVVLLITAVSTVLYSLNFTMTRSALHQESMTMLRDEGYTSLDYMGRRLRMARSATILTDNNGTLAPLVNNVATNLRFQMATDLDGNGLAIDDEFNVELTAPLVFRSDDNDANGDGFSTRQLVHMDTNGNVVRVLSNHLRPGGLSFQRTAAGIQITVALEHPGQGLRPTAAVTLSLVVDPRN